MLSCNLAHEVGGTLFHAYGPSYYAFSRIDASRVITTTGQPVELGCLGTDTILASPTGPLPNQVTFTALDTLVSHTAPVPD